MKSNTFPSCFLKRVRDWKTAYVAKHGLMAAWEKFSSGNLDGLQKSDPELWQAFYDYVKEHPEAIERFKIDTE